MKTNDEEEAVREGRWTDKAVVRSYRRRSRELCHYAIRVIDTVLKMDGRRMGSTTHTAIDGLLAGRTSSTGI